MQDQEIKLIPIDRIRVVNPRVRERKKFEQIVQSIKNLGLKKPIQVSLRQAHEGDEPGYDLVCGQGRMEAFMALGQKEIPAIIVELTKEQRMLRSLIENMARRRADAFELMREIERLKNQGYTNLEIGKKLDICDVTVGGYLALSKAGEERLIDATIRGKIPLSVAIEIAKTDDIEAQREMLKAYDGKEIKGMAIRTLKRIIEQRRFLGKGRERGVRHRATSAESLVNAYRKECQRQKTLVRKAKLCGAKLLFVETAFKKLMADENFVTLLKAEALMTMPKGLWEKVGPARPG